MSATRRKPVFIPWGRPLALALVLILAGSGLLRSGGSLAHLGLALAVLFAGGLQLQSALVRLRGQVIERAATGRLRLPDGWSSANNLPLPHGGDLDLLITGPAGQAFAVEIKSYRCLKIKSRLSKTLVRCNGRPPRNDPLRQVRQAARTVRAVPVLWLPTGDRRRPFVVDGVLVVHGGQRRLLRAIRTAWAL